jgi:hypothetical protein
MPRYALTVGHYLIVETTVTLDAPDRTQVRQLAENMKDRGTFGVIAWEVKDANLQAPWTVASRNTELETVQEVQP